MNKQSHAYADHCVSCGAPISAEGAQLCWKCEHRIKPRQSIGVRIIRIMGAILMIIGFLWAFAICGLLESDEISFWQAAAQTVGCVASMFIGRGLFGGADDE